MSVDMRPSPAILHVCREAAAVFFATLPHAYIKVAALCLAAASCCMWHLLAKCTATAAIFSGSPYHLVSHPSQLWKSTDMDGACRPTCLPEPSLQCGCRMNLNTKATRGQSLCAECIMAMHMRRSSPCYFSRANCRALNLTTPPPSPPCAGVRPCTNCTWLATIAGACRSKFLWAAARSTINGAAAAKLCRVRRWGRVCGRM